MSIKFSDKSVTYPKGFKAAAVNAGFKEGRDDMAMIYSEKPANCAIVMTTNQVKAAPVIWDQQITASGEPKQAIVVNVGSANACTGELGYENARATSEEAAAFLDLKPEEVLVSSTGVIGVQLDMEKIQSGIHQLASSLSDSKESGKSAAGAILTTDTKVKTASAEFEIDGKTVRIGAMAKGSGMIRPNMATMLSFACTDVSIDQSLLQKVLFDIAQDTYNMISVDGDMSTNDTAIVLANGMAENRRITDLNSEAGQIFYKALFEVEKTLANAIVKDGEGATKRIQAHITGAIDKQEARTLARSIIESSLVKTALFGEDANWGRIISSLGAADAAFDQNKAELIIQSKNGNIVLFQNGVPLDFNEDKALKILQAEDIEIEVDVGLGEAEATAWGCDLSYDYVKINGEYRT